MSVAICQTPAALFHVGTAHKPTRHANSAAPDHVDIWSMIQSQNMTCPPATTSTYIHPLVRQSRTLLNLEMCTESLGSETGSNDFDDLSWFSMSSTQVASKKTNQLGFIKGVVNGRREVPPEVNCQFSYNKSSPQRSFPPPLSSISCLDGSSIHMRPYRRDGRLTVESVPIPSQNYLCARRHEGRLLLSFSTTSICHPDIIDSETTDTIPPQHHYVKYKEIMKAPEPINNEDEENHEIEIANGEDENCEEIAYVNDGDEEDEEIEDEEEEEEVEVVDRGTIVEVKVSTQPLQQNRAKVLRSSVVINKFVGGEPLSNENRWLESQAPILAPRRRMTANTTTAATVAVAASSVSVSAEVVGQCMPATESKIIFTSKRQNREEMLHNMLRCSELRRPLFFREPCCTATS